MAPFAERDTYNGRDRTLRLYVGRSGERDWCAARRLGGTCVELYVGLDCGRAVDNRFQHFVCARARRVHIVANPAHFR